MSAPSVPSVPPRPARMPKEPPRSVTMGAEIPLIPPRPAHRIDRSASPNGDSFAPSPLNESSFVVNHKGNHNDLYRASFANLALPTGSNEPSVKLPSIGQEGVEYANFYENAAAAEELAAAQSDEVTSAPQTRNVGEDLELHAPKPGLPTSSAKARIATVTRTDSSQAAAMGLGKIAGDDRDPHLRPLRAKASFTSHDSSTPLERVSSTQSAGDGEQGIPEIGQRVPMYPNAGDVQAPSPSPFLTGGSTPGFGPSGEGQHRGVRHHARTRSGREHFHAPPGSYGLHGHGTTVHDRFEKAWYEKHPEALEREEHGEYGPGIGGGRGEWALSREDLDRIVRETASRGAGVDQVGTDSPSSGTSPAVLGTPNEEIGYLASEEYAAKLASSRPASVAHNHKAQSIASQGHTESSLRKESFTADLAAKDGSSKSQSSRSIADESDNAIESADDENVIHIDPPPHRSDKIHGGGYDPPTEDLGPLGGNTTEEGGWIDERGYGVPILASDEISKEPGAENLHPAISPPLERSASELHGAWDPEHTSHSMGLSRTVSRGSSVPGSRGNSRPTSMIGAAHPALARFISLDDREEMGTPLEDVEEYEPLFPEDDEEEKDEKAPKAKSFKSTRPSMLARHKFPSQDVWEDAPSSAQLQATVSTPAIPEDDAQTVIADPEEDKAPTTNDEGDPLAQPPDTGNDSLPPADRVLHRMIPHFKPNVQEEVDSSSELHQQRQRFPSRDIWEDTPASLQLQTIVSTPQMDEPQSARDPLEAFVDDGRASTAEGANKAVQPSGEAEQGSTGASSSTGKPEVPAIPPRPAKTKGASGSETTAQPAVPPRPGRRIPDGGPATAGKSAADDTTTNASPISAQTSFDSVGEKVKTEQRSSSSTSTSERKAPAIPERAKPQVPARPARVVAGEGSTSKNDATTAKPKPAVPARPNGSKIAALKAGFMSDLDKRLQMGPPGIKPAEKTEDHQPEQEIEKEKAPLSDARKGRARGPARRKPAASPSSDAIADADSKPETETSVKFQVSKPIMIWQMTPDGNVELTGRSHASLKASSVDDMNRSKEATRGPETDHHDVGPSTEETDLPPASATETSPDVTTPKPAKGGVEEPVTTSEDVLQDVNQEEAEPSKKPLEA
ncbi:MAG: hypothetical protein M1823_000830 [Watsoniomyces obsoletus]|nr:MAG: hypothetical protein M1823_000830 [Watsoniomyces obsoletus]